MSIKLFTESNFTDIADAIRYKRGASASTTYTLDDMADEIALISGGGDTFVTSMELTVPSSSVSSSFTLSAELGADVTGTPSFEGLLGGATVNFYKVMDEGNDIIVSTNTTNANGVATSDSLTITEDTDFYAQFSTVDCFPTTTSTTKTVTYNGWRNTYQEVEWIGNSGTQYLNLGVTSDTNNIRVVTKVTNNSTSQNCTVFGNNNSGYDSSLYYHFTCYNDKWYWGNNGTENNGGSYSTTIGTEYIIDFNNNNCIIVNDTTIGSNLNLTLKGQLSLGYRGSNNGAKGKYNYYYFKVYEGDTLIRDLVPVYRISDDVIGMYDTVNDVFYTNNGTGIFTKGGDVE